MVLEQMHIYMQKEEKNETEREDKKEPDSHSTKKLIHN